MKAFTHDSLLLKKSDARMKYYRRNKEDKKAIHFGQRKLLLSEIWFLINYVEKAKFSNVSSIGNDIKITPHVVYAGAADGTHIAILSELFPNITFHLYDPRKFRIKSTDKIFIYNQYFTNKDASYWKDQQKINNNIFFISDIRTADYRTMSPEINEETIISDNRLQEKWVKIIKPVAAFCKYRPPYPITAKYKTFKYLDGLIFKQPWAPQTSTETRLLIKTQENNRIAEKDYDTELYQDQMFYHNTVIREQFRYSADNIDAPELLNDWDSTAEYEILKQYFINKNNEEDVENKVKKLSKEITERLLQHLSDSEKFTLATLRQGLTINNVVVRSTTELASIKIQDKKD